MTALDFTDLFNLAQTVKSREGPESARIVLRERIRKEARLSPGVANAVAMDVLDGNPDSIWNLQKEESTSPLRLLSKDAEGPVIYGPASVSIVDRENDLITGPALKDALPQLLKRARFSLQHLDILVGNILEKWVDPSTGEVFETTVRPVTKDDLDRFEKLRKSNVNEGDEALFVVGQLYKDTTFNEEVIEDVMKGKLASFSISGQAVSEGPKQVCDGFDCKLVNRIDKIDLSATTICQEGMNQGSGFVVLRKSCGCKEPHMQKEVPPEESEEEDLQVGNPKYPRGQTVHGEPSDVQDTEQEMDAEEAQYPGGSDRMEDAPTEDGQVGERPSGYFQRLWKELEDSEGILDDEEVDDYYDEEEDLDEMLLDITEDEKAITPGTTGGGGMGGGVVQCSMKELSKLEKRLVLEKMERI